MKSYFYLFLLIAATHSLVGCKSPENIQATTSSAAADSEGFAALSRGFLAPDRSYHPETWFHLNGNNITKEGLTLDLEAIKAAGLQGIHLFNKNGRPYPDVPPVEILSDEWEDMIRHAADECQRLGLKFTMQNCPGWSMTGGPWVPVEEAQRELVETVYQLEGGQDYDEVLALDERYPTEDFDYQEVRVLAFPRPEGDENEYYIANTISSNNPVVPWEMIFDPRKTLDFNAKDLPDSLKAFAAKGISDIDGEHSWVKVGFEEEVSLRSIKLSPIRTMIMDRQYPVVEKEIKVQAFIDGELQEVATLAIPTANWTDSQYDLTLAVPETRAREFILTFQGQHPILPSSIQLTGQSRTHNHQAKAAKALRGLEKESKNHYTQEAYIDPKTILDLSDKLDDSGRLTWEVPAGSWTLIRFGHINMRRTNKPAVPEATGWEASKMDKAAIENHLRNGMIGDLIKDGGPISEGKLYGLLIDSWESFIPTWTIDDEGMLEEFKTRRGYDMSPYLPATMGYIIESPEVTSKFLRDLRQTTDDVIVENFFEHFATIAHEMGALVYTEGAGGEVLPVDPMRYYGVSDIPMTEFWYPKAPSNQNEFAKPILSAASAMHLYDKPLLAAEACTQLDVQWNEHPFDVKYLIDYNFTKGVNHLVFHTFSHTPQKEVYPGSSFGGNIGFPLVRQQTWWKYMADWVDYLSRNQYVLQQGEYVADVLWYLGDHLERPPFDLNDFPEGYRYDYLNAEILQSRLSVEQGAISVKGAGKYRIIMLRDSEEMTLKTLQKLQELVLDGAVILGDKPMSSPSLMDGEADIMLLQEISDQLWGKTKRGSQNVGKGKVYWGMSVDQVLQAEQVEQDLIVPEGLDIDWIHRQTDEADIYFVSSKSPHAIDVSLSFRIQKGYPQLWDAYTGAQHDALVWTKEGSRTQVALSLDASGSQIIVFPKGDKKPFATKITSGQQTILSAESGWSQQYPEGETSTLRLKDDGIYFTKAGEYQVQSSTGTRKIQVSVKERSLQENWSAAFEGDWDTARELQMDKLMSLTDLEDEAIRHYSGTVTYTKELSVDNLGEMMQLDLGAVANIAEVWCNGQKVAVRWAPPYIFDLSQHLKSGTNDLTIKVTNTWRNQLIYDHTRSADNKKTWTTNPPAASEKTLDKAGLIGPVRLFSIN